MYASRLIVILHDTQAVNPDTVNAQCSRKTYGVPDCRGYLTPMLRLCAQGTFASQIVHVGSRGLKQGGCSPYVA